uniref:Uncharacterized protein n=1 Tax=Percolomonas cosmopolitus TaxID=63605 RepID=A0A7S1PIQ5_9EUKA|mmetsp:Transcript_8368/g.30952  ORF Transcript_8368/g.30952 Transcript_8368/m.30952 type:complete len:593 (+) Transcript_8368:87-1865(+)
MTDFLSFLQEKLGIADGMDMLPGEENILTFKLHTPNTFAHHRNTPKLLAHNGRLWHHLNGRANKYYWHFQTPQINFDTLQGHFSVEDDMSDEWFFVNQILKYTAEMDQDCVAELTDSDGEFLLIEGAVHLPEWAEPETIENRSFVYRGKLHIIPLDVAKIIESPEKGADILRANSSKTEASKKVQRAITKRITLSGVDKSTHTAKVVLPHKVAQVLKVDPRLLAMAVYAFVNRDEEIPELSTRFMSKEKTFDSVEMMIPFTRCLYAQLYHQAFSKQPIEAFKCDPKDPEFHANDVGMKIAMGMDLLYQDNPELWLINVLDLEKLMKETQFETDEAYKAFSEELKNLKYLHTEDDETERRELYLIMHHDLLSQTISVAKYIDQILTQPSVEAQTAEQLQIGLPEIKPDDSLNWMGDESELEQMMKHKLQQQMDDDERVDGNDLGEDEQMRRMAEFFAHGMQGFMGGESDMDGVDPEQMEDLMKHMQESGVIGDFFADGEDEDEGEHDEEMMNAFGMMDDELLNYPGLGDEREQLQNPEFFMQHLLRGHQAESDLGGVGPLNTMLAGMGMHLPASRFEEFNDEEEASGSDEEQI